jgi:C4-dicarboxylate transporter DctM subunit
VSASTLAIGSLALVMGLIAVRVPIGVALGVVSLLGIAYLRNVDVAFSLMGDVPFAFVSNWELTAIPMFLLMGSLINHSGISASIFRAAKLWLGNVPGGLAVAANVAGAGFAAGCGSSVASAAAMGKIAVPQMLKHGYDEALATGTVAASGTLAALIPPSILMVLYGVFAQVSIVKLLIAGVIPGLLTAAVYTAMIVALCTWKPHLAPKAAPEDASWRERWRAIGEIWPLLLVILGMIGGLYAGVFTPTEAGAGGAAIALVVGLAQRRLSREAIRQSLHDALKSSAQIFFVGIGAVMYTKFLSLAGVAPMLTELMGSWQYDPLLLVVAVSLIYIVLGMFLDPLGIMLITIPIFVPMFQALDLDLIWFGVLVVKYVEIGMITPPVGFNVFVLKNALGEKVALEKIFRGCGYFLACEVLIMAILIAYPQISLWLPNNL